jgi:hypothetical protein
MPDYGATYYFAIRSFDEADNESVIDVKTATPGQQANAYAPDFVPLAALNFQAIPSQDQVTLSWTPNTHNDFWKYQVYRSSLSAATLTFYTEFSTETTSAYVDVGLANGVTYYYQLFTVDRGTPTYIGTPLSSGTAILSAVTTALSPNQPIIISSETVAVSTQSISWSWTHATPPNVNGLRVLVGTVNVSGDLAPGTTSYVETGLLPNQQVTARVQAFNGAGSGTSDPFTRFALANPPSSSTFVSVADKSMQISWAANGNQGTPIYSIQYSLDSGFAGSTNLQTSLTNLVIGNLLPGRVYHVRVRTLNGDNIPSGYDVTLTTTTLGSPDVVAPTTPGGLYAEVVSVAGSSATIRLTWDPVIRNVDGSNISDLGGYIVHAESTHLLDESGWIEPSITTTTITMNVSINPPTYVAVRAIDTNGNQSVMSAILRTDNMNLIVLADDRISRIEFPMSSAVQLRANWAANKGVTRYVLGKEVVSDYGTNRVIKSVRFSVYKGDSPTAAQDYAFSSADARIYIYYDIMGSQIVQGTMARKSYFQNQSDFSTQAADNIGTPIVTASNAASKMSLFWNNGVHWVKVGGTVDTMGQYVTFRTSRLGNYQIKAAAQLGDVSLVQVYPRIISPNGDGANDAAIFQFGEGQIAGVSLTGEIFDINGIKIATLRPGPDPDSTLMWDGKTDGGNPAPSGIYIYQISIGGARANGTVVVAR